MEREREGGTERGKEGGKEEYKVEGGEGEGKRDTLSKYLGNVVHRLLAFKQKPSRWL